MMRARNSKGKGKGKEMINPAKRGATKDDVNEGRNKRAKQSAGSSLVSGSSSLVFGSSSQRSVGFSSPVGEHRLKSGYFSTN
jgi:hypothetical protein